MSIDTHLYVGNRWTLDDIVDTIKAVRAEQIKANGNNFIVESCHVTALGMFRIFFEGRMMYVHSHTETPLGRCTLLSLGCDEHSQNIMRDIASVLGGLWEVDDCSGKMEMFDGELTEEGKLPYHLKSAIIQGLDADDINGLKEHVDGWNKKHGR